MKVGKHSIDGHYDGRDDPAQSVSVKNPSTNKLPLWGP